MKLFSILSKSSSNRYSIAHLDDTTMFGKQAVSSLLTEPIYAESDTTLTTCQSMTESSIEDVATHGPSSIFGRWKAHRISLYLRKGDRKSGIITNTMSEARTVLTNKKGRQSKYEQSMQSPPVNAISPSLRRQSTLVQRCRRLFSLRRRDQSGKKGRPESYADAAIQTQHALLLDSLSGACIEDDVFRRVAPTALVLPYASQAMTTLASTMMRPGHASTESVLLQREDDEIASVLDARVASQSDQHVGSDHLLENDPDPITSEQKAMHLDEMYIGGQQPVMAGINAAIDTELDAIVNMYASCDRTHNIRNAFNYIGEWEIVSKQVLALFNHGSTGIQLDDLAAMIRRCANRHPSTQLHHKFHELVEACMLVLHARLLHLQGKVLLEKMIQIWRTFYSHILGHLEIIFKGLHDLSVRDIMLTGFRDFVFLPSSIRIVEALQLLSHENSSHNKQKMASIVQMCGLLANISHQSVQHASMLTTWKQVISCCRGTDPKTHE